MKNTLTTLNFWQKSFFYLILVARINAEPAKNILIDDFEDPGSWKSAMPPATVEKYDHPKFGKAAMKIKMPGIIRKNYGRFWFPESDKVRMDEFQGISFWIKGDGSDNWGNITIGDRYGYNYFHYFPLKNREWENITVSWNDLIPQGQYDPINSHRCALVPSAIVNVEFGTGWKIFHNNMNIPAHEFCVDNLEFAREVKGEPLPPPGCAPIGKVLAKLRAKQPVKIGCLGDSITVGVGLKTPETSRYARVLESMLRKEFGYDQVSVESRAVGGSDSVWGRSWLQRDFCGIQPDMVILHYGYNDKSRKFTSAFFAQSMEDYVNRIERKTNGEACLVLIPTMPGIGPRINMLDDYAGEIRALAKKRGLDCVDLHHVLKNTANLPSYFADMAHPNETGHQLMAATICNHIKNLAPNKPQNAGQ
ncbi:MAG: GDSL-type esterase/lipase family protein [Verrucomicrobiae bacterium]|nr:GDSL-type esterase/lipase family protein [Verrucomicrobiae bacterium]